VNIFNCHEPGLYRRWKLDVVVGNIGPVMPLVHNGGPLPAVNGSADHVPVVDVRILPHDRCMLIGIIHLDGVHRAHGPEIALEPLARAARGGTPVGLDILVHRMVRNVSPVRGGDACGLAIVQQHPPRKPALKVIRRAVKAFSAPTQSTAPDGSFTLSESLPDHRTPTPDEAVFDRADNEKLHDFLEQLDERERAILSMRFGLGNTEPMTLKEIGKKIGLTRERVRQIEAQTLRKLNQLLGENK